MSLIHPFSAPPANGEVLEVAPGVLWLRMALPFDLDHINLWALADGDGWTLVDTGVGDDETKGAWERLLAGPLGGRAVTRLICTHFHPDHMGLAGWLGQRCGVDLTCTQAEWLFGRMLCLDDGAAYADSQAEHYRRMGFAEGFVEGARKRGNTYSPRVVPVPPRFLRIRDGEVLTIGGREWRVIVGEGHSVEHAALYCAEAGLLISGDQVLPRISPLVGVWQQDPEGDPLGLFLDGIARLAGLPAETLVLPSHGLPFVGLGQRVAELAAHHQQRLDRTVAACAEPATVLEVLAHLFRHALNPMQMAFAAGETLAHLNRLVATGHLRRERRADGVWLFRRV